MQNSFRILLAALFLCFSATSLASAGGGGDERRLRVADDLGTGPVKAVISPVTKQPRADGDVCGTRTLRISRMLESGETLWTVRDGYEECGFDGVLSLEELSITDLDGNGLSEIWMAYRTGCRSDISPVAMKVIMYEGVKKHAMRGKTRMPDGSGGTLGGQARFDDAFENAPAAFRQHARRIWNAHVNEFK